jgi:hypothetical protein
MRWFRNLSGANKVVVAVILGALLLSAGFAGYHRWDARAHYVPAKARVTWIVDNCSLERRRSSSQRRREIGPMDCEAAQLKQSQVYSRYSLRRHRHVGYSYTSPVDGRAHTGSISATPSDYPDLHAGAEIDILAHKTDASKSRRPL